MFPGQPFTFRIEVEQGGTYYGCSGGHFCPLYNLGLRMNVKIPTSFLQAHIFVNVPREMEFSKKGMATRLRFRFQRMGTKRDGFTIRGRIDVLE